MWQAWARVTAVALLCRSVGGMALGERLSGRVTGPEGYAIPDGLAAQGDSRGLEIWGCLGDDECMSTGFDEVSMAQLWRDVTDFSRGMETNELKFARARAARRLVHDTKGRIFALDKDDKHIVSGVCFDAERSHIAAVMTETCRRRQRIATILMAVAVGFLRSKGCTSTWLEVQDCSPHLLGFYQRQGFEVDESTSAKVPRATVMRLDLTRPSALLTMIDQNPSAPDAADSRSTLAEPWWSALLNPFLREC